jgi:hypothetical protein
MWNIKFKKIVVFTSVLLLQPMVTPGSLALAKKKSPPKAYSFIVEGGKASQAECDGERKLPKLKHLKDYSKYSSYMGSELQSPEIKGKADEEMWKHVFRAKEVCNTVLAKTPSALESSTVKAGKPELPPDDSADSDDDSDKSDKSDSPDKADGPDSE